VERAAKTLGFYAALSKGGVGLTDVDPNNTQKILIERSGRPKIDVEIFSLHGKILGDGVFEAATNRPAYAAASASLQPI
jgi:hypothetical protein